MSLKHNVIANYVGQAYTALIGIVMVPVYLHYLGKEAYGLIGFYAVLSGWLALLDLGLTPAFGREAARYQSGTVKAGDFRSLLRAILILFSGLSLVVISVVSVLSGFISTHWLKVETIPQGEIRTAIVLMGFVFVLRWPAEIFRSLLTGFEHQVWLNIINIMTATFRFIGILLVFKYVGASPKIFFLFQGAIAVLELIILAVISHRFLPAWPEKDKQPWSLASINRIWNFALSSVALSLIWIIMTQTDKLILTRLLPLSIYAYYSISVSAAMGILLILGPITQAVLPRLTRLVSEKNDSGFLSLYRKTTRMVSVFAGSASVILAVYPQKILWVWTGDMELSFSAATVLAFSALGYALLTLSDIQYALQVARGDLRYHITGTLFFILILIPSLIWATLQHGMQGAAITWMMVNLLFLLGWVPLVHHHFLPNFHKTWMLHDLLPVALILGATAFLMSFFPINGDSRIQIILWLAVWSSITLFSAGSATPEGRSVIMKVSKKCLLFFQN